MTKKPETKEVKPETTTTPEAEPVNMSPSIEETKYSSDVNVAGSMTPEQAKEITDKELTNRKARGEKVVETPQGTWAETQAQNGLTIRTRVA